MTKNVSINKEIRVMSSSAGKTPSGELVFVYIYVKPGYSTHIVDPYVYEVPNRDEENNFAVAWVDTSKLDTVTAVEGVRLIREVIPPAVNIGSVTTQGDTVLKTANVRSLYGYSGSGMKIGVISDGVDHLSASVATGDLPNNVHVLSNTQGGDEGTAMLEIIHDMVPNATLYFHDDGSNTVAFDAGIDALISNGCTVICDDISWPGEPFFEDGPVASHVESALSTYTIVYISSAGNFAAAGYQDGHYQGTYYNSGSCSAGGCWNDFSSGSNSNYEELYVDIPAGSSVQVVLEWNDKFGQSGNDYDLYLWDYNSGNRLDYSVTTQSGTGDPLEYFTYTNTGSTPITGEIEVWKSNSAAVKTLGVYIYPSNGASVYSDNLVASSSIYGQAAAPDVVSVAAMDYSTPSTIEDFSSRGPVMITYPSPVTRVKPDISGVDDVSVSGAASDLNPFFGTSAATPGIAAIVAQIWGAHPYLTPAQVRNALYTSAVDLGTPGKDTTFGYGRADALAMATATYIPPPAITVISPPAGLTAGGTTVTITGTSFTGATAVKFGTIAATSYTVDSDTSITTTSPAHATGSVDITVTTPNGTSAPGASDQFTYGSSVSASFTSNVSVIRTNDCVQFNDTSTGSPTSWNWSFGDGVISTTQNPAHQYTANGTYAVNLTAKNAIGANSAYATINVYDQPLGDFTGSPTSVLRGHDVAFNGTTTGFTTGWAWDFDAGASPSTSTSRNQTVTYSTPGSKTVTLTRSNPFESNTTTKVGYITVTIPPVGTLPFTANITAGGNNLTIQFTDLSPGTPLSWNWSFGDGTFSGLQNPVHTYTQTDDSRRWYDVGLNVTNASGYTSILQPDYIHVMSFSEYYRSISGTPGNIDTATFVQIVEDWRLQRPVLTFTVSPSTPVFVGLVEDWRLQRPLT
ncbi:MAG: PKD domain-containing protein [Methanoregula sp.]|uniref:S8 family peptidase n=1 Tax=Methanoregula sp. TaxID=2052170 RepID=UPI003D149370